MFGLWSKPKLAVFLNNKVYALDMHTAGNDYLRTKEFSDINSISGTRDWTYSSGILNGHYGAAAIVGDGDLRLTFNNNEFTVDQGSDVYIFKTQNEKTLISFNGAF